MPIVNYSIYEARNLASTESYVFLGKGALNIENYKNINTDNGCSSIFLFASLVGGNNNFRIDPATENDPNIFMDSKWYAFRSAGNDSLDIKVANNVISDVINTGTKTTVYFKSITSDGTIVVQGGNSSYTYSVSGAVGNLENDSNYSDIMLRSHKYDCHNICLDGSSGFYYGKKGIPGNTDVLFLFKSLVGGTCIKVDYTDTSYTVNFDTENPLCNPGTFNPSTTVLPKTQNNKCSSSYSLLDRPGWKFATDNIDSTNNICK
jgi:hypothetical protein